MNINTIQSDICVGCRVCEYTCPVNSIIMQKDSEGFIIPHADNTCINCGKCLSTCIAQKSSRMSKNTQSIKAFIVQSNQDSLQNSSSGGVFRIIADAVIKDGGVVVGCVFDKQFEAVLEVTDDPEMLNRMQGSKYVFSNTNNCYKRVKNELLSGRKVLFTGSPCQCEALKSYLEICYDNLFLMDFICHGMGSQDMLHAYIKYCESLIGGKLKTIKMRDKLICGWGHTMTQIYEMKDGKKKAISHIGKMDSYLYGYISGYYNRRVCYGCNRNKDRAIADITVCDYWGATNDKELQQKIDIHKGVSTVILNGQKGESLLEILCNSAKCYPTTLEKMSVDNPSIINDRTGIIPNLRNDIYRILQIKGYHYLKNHWLLPKDYVIRWGYYLFRYKIPAMLKGRIGRK